MSPYNLETTTSTASQQYIYINDIYNKTRKYINKLWNDRLKTDESLLIKANGTDEYTQDMYIYNDLPVIARKNYFKW